MDVREYIKQKIKEVDSDIDLSKGSPIYDLFINPLSTIMNDSLEFEEDMRNAIGIDNAEQLDEDMLDSVASNFLVSRDEGKKATGTINLFYDSPTSVEIPAGTLFESDDGLIYQTVNDFSITRNSMALNSGYYPLFTTGSINIEAEVEGSEYTSRSNSINTVISDLNPSPASVTNVEPVTQGADKEDNVALKTKIKNSIANKTTASEAGLTRVVTESFSTIKNLTIKGAGDPEMTRDIVYSGQQMGDYYISDYNYTVSGLHSYPYNQSVGYIGFFQDTDDTTDISLPDPSDFTSEMSNEMYRGLYKQSDALYAQAERYQVMEEYFNNSETSTGYDRNWVKSDSQKSLGVLIGDEEVTVDSGGIKLGARFDPDNDRYGWITPSVLDNIKDNFNRLFSEQLMSGEEIVQAIDTDSYEGLVNKLEDAKIEAETNNYSPVFQRPIDQHVGIEITGSFKTNDATDDGQMSYITVKRHPEAGLAWDGYGVAWKKGDGSSYNIYIVDNDALSNDHFITNTNFISPEGSVNQFLAATKKEILADTWYQFLIKINSKNGIDVWIDTEADFPDTPGDENKTISRGQTYPPYVTQSAGDHFGIGVMETQDYEWWYKELEINSIMQTYPMHLFKMHADDTNFEDGGPFSVNYNGVGFGETSSNDATKLYIRNTNTDSWEDVGSHEKHSDDSPDNMSISKAYNSIDNYRDGQDKINVLATPYNYEDDDHILRSYYISIANVLASGYHAGNVVDAYIEDQDSITVGTVNVIPLDNEIKLKTVEGVNKPVIDIDNVKRAVTDTELVRNEDYTVSHFIESLTFSEDDDIRIIVNDEFLGIELVVTYRYYEDGSSVQSLIDSEEYRTPGLDNLVKSFAYYIVDVESFDYEGNPAESEIQEALIDYINNIEDGKLDKSDLISAAYDAGATYVDSDISLGLKKQDYQGNIEILSEADGDVISSRIELNNSELEAFYADATSVYGVTKL